MQPWVILQLLILLLLANGTPVIVKRLWGHRFSYPLDGGVRFFDGQAIFGPSKTIRGILSSILVTTLSAPLIGLEWQGGAAIGGGAMAGDLLSSFVKRRLRFPPSSRATGLDQVPESLLPLLVCRWMMPVTFTDIFIAVALFFVGEIFLSRVLYRLRLRSRPY